MKISTTSKNTLFLFANQVYNKITAVIFFSLAARLLGIDNFSKYVLILTFISFFYIISDWGLSTLTIRNVARRTEETNEYLKQTILLRIVFSLLSYFALLAVILLLRYPKDIVLLISIVGLSLFTNNILNSYNATFSAHEKMHIPAVIGMVFSTLFLFLGVLILYLNLGLFVIMSLILFLGIINVVVTNKLIKKYYGYTLKFDLSLNYTYFKKIIAQATPFAVLSILSIIYFRVDTIMLSKLQPLETVGLYNAAYKVIEFLRFIPVCLLGAYFPMMSRHAKTSIEDLRKNYFKTTGILLAVIIPVVIICSLFATKIILLLFGSAYLPAASALRILIWAGFIMYLSAPIGNVLYNSNKIMLFVPFAVFNTLLNIILNFIFIPKYSYIGASYTTLVTEITGFIIQIWFIKEIIFHKKNSKLNLLS